VKWQAGASPRSLAEEKARRPSWDDESEVGPEMLGKCPQLKADGYNLGDKPPRTARQVQPLHAAHRRSRTELAVTAGRLRPLYPPHSIAPTGTISLSPANNASNGISFRTITPATSFAKPKSKRKLFSFELLAYRHSEQPGRHAVRRRMTKKPDYWPSDDVTLPST